MSSFLNKLTFHNVKKAVASSTSSSEHPTEADDPVFEGAFHDFSHYHAAVVALDQSLNEYAKHYFDLFHCSSTIIHDLSSAVTNDDAAAIRNTFSATRDAHATLTGEREQELSSELRTSCMGPIKSELELHIKLLNTVQQRNELARELDYYSSKLESLLKDKATAEAKGKSIDAEKLERNQKKKDEAVAVYTTVNTETIAQLRQAVERKAALLMDVFGAFSDVERKVAAMYSKAVEGETSAVASSTSKPTGISVDLSRGPTVSLGLEGATLTAASPPPSYQSTPYAVAPPAGVRRPASPQPPPPKDPPPPPRRLG